MASGIDIFNATFRTPDFGGQGGSIGQALGRGAKQNRLYAEEEAKKKRLFDMLAKAKQRQEQFKTPERYVYGAAEVEEDAINKQMGEQRASLDSLGKSEVPPALMQEAQRLAQAELEGVDTISSDEAMALDSATYTAPSVSVDGTIDDIDVNAEEAALNRPPIYEELFSQKVEENIKKLQGKHRKAQEAENARWYKQRMGGVRRGIEDRTAEMQGFDISEEAPGFENQSLSNIGQYSPKVGFDLMIPKKGSGVTGNMAIMKEHMGQQADVAQKLNNLSVKFGGMNPGDEGYKEVKDAFDNLILEHDKLALKPSMKWDKKDSTLDFVRATENEKRKAEELALNKTKYDDVKYKDHRDNMQRTLKPEIKLLGSLQKLSGQLELAGRGNPQALKMVASVLSRASSDEAINIGEMDLGLDKSAMAWMSNLPNRALGTGALITERDAKNMREVYQQLTKGLEKTLNSKDGALHKGYGDWKAGSSQDTSISKGRFIRSVIGKDYKAAPKWSGNVGFTTSNQPKAKTNAVTFDADSGGR
jgi:hypothetical protein